MDFLKKIAYNKHTYSKPKEFVSGSNCAIYCHDAHRQNCINQLSVYRCSFTTLKE